MAIKSSRIEFRDFLFLVIAFFTHPAYYGDHIIGGLANAVHLWLYRCIDSPSRIAISKVVSHRFIQRCLPRGTGLIDSMKSNHNKEDNVISRIVIISLGCRSSAWQSPSFFQIHRDANYFIIPKIRLVSATR